MSDCSGHHVSLKATLRYLKRARTRHVVKGEWWHHHLNTSARLLVMLLNMFLCKHWYIYFFLKVFFPFTSLCLSAALPLLAEGSTFLVPLYNLHNPQPFSTGCEAYSSPVLVVWVLCVEKKVGPCSHLPASKTFKKGLWCSGFFGFCFCFFLSLEMS